MQFSNTPQQYGFISAMLHWLTALVVYGMFALGLWMVTLSYYDGLVSPGTGIAQKHRDPADDGPGRAGHLASDLATAESAEKLFGP